MGTRILLGREYIAEVPALMEEARRDLRVLMFLAQLQGKGVKHTSRALIEKLWAKRREGVQVCVLLNGGGRGGRVVGVNRLAADYLRGKGVEVRMLPGHQLLHAKVIIVDDRVAIVGSHNWSPPSLERNFEVSVVVEEREAVERLCAAFDAVWSGARTFC